MHIMQDRFPLWRQRHPGFRWCHFYRLDIPRYRCTKYASSKISFYPRWFWGAICPWMVHVLENIVEMISDEKLPKVA